MVLLVHFSGGDERMLRVKLQFAVICCLSMPAGSCQCMKVLKEGNGPQPKATDSVTVNYRGTLINGTEFDSSYKRGQPATFPINGVIKGWTEALQLMKVGSKYQLFIPSNLAYGERSVGPEIGANSTLIFEVELLETKPAPTPAPPVPSPAASPSPKK